MKLNRATRARIEADMTSTVDPAGSTVEVKVDAVWYPAEWLADATTGTASINGVTVPRWFRTARTTGRFCGPDATALGATVLAFGRHSTKTRVSLDGDQLVAESDPIDVG